MRAYADVEPALAGELHAALAGELPAGWDAGLDDLVTEPKKQATRKASQQAINAIAPKLPALVGGSADLAESNLTDITGGGDLTATEAGRTLRFGVREHGMGAISNGLAAHGGLRPFCATFLVFSDYMRPSVRLAALMGLPVVYVWTHDSIGLGGDGPTHQPVEHLGSLRLMPNLWVMRPADGPETAEAWRAAIARTDGPTALALSRQELPPIDRTRYASASGLHRGAYVLAEASGGEPELILLATGSEVWLALAGPGAAAAGDRSAGGGGGQHCPVAPVGRPKGRGGGHRPLRGVGAWRDGPHQVRVHRGQRRRAGPGRAAPGVRREGAHAAQSVGLTGQGGRQ
jgi:transketolase